MYYTTKHVETCQKYVVRKIQKLFNEDGELHHRYNRKSFSKKCFLAPNIVTTGTFKINYELSCV